MQFNPYGLDLSFKNVSLKMLSKLLNKQTHQTNKQTNLLYIDYGHNNPLQVNAAESTFLFLHISHSPSSM